MTKRRKTTKLSIESLIENNLPIYVKNNTVRALQGKGLIFLTLMSPNGTTVPVKIPRTYLPLCLNDFAPPSTIANSPDLRTYIRKGILTLLDPEDAERELGNPENQLELKRLLVSEFSQDNEFLTGRVSGFIEDIDNVEEMEQFNKTVMGLDDASIEAEAQPVTPRVLALVERSREGTTSVHGILAELKNDEDLLETNEVDCHYILNNVKDGQIKNFVQRILSARAGEEDAVADPAKPQVGSLPKSKGKKGSRAARKSNSPKKN